VVQGAVVADLGGLAHHHAHAVVDEHPAADLRPGMDLDARQPAGQGAGGARQNGRADPAGAEAAARKYFQVSASSLSPSQAALLAAILPSPHTWSPLDPSEFVRERQRKIMMDMEKMPVGRFRKR